MDKIKIHALRCGQVRTTKYLPFNPDNKPLMTVAGVCVPQKDSRSLCRFDMRKDYREERQIRIADI